MKNMNGLRLAALAAGLLGATAIGAATDSAMAQMRVHGSAGGFHGTVRTGGWHGSGWHGGTWRGTTAWNHRGWGGRGGYWRGGHWYPGWRGGVAVGFYGGYPYYDPYYYGYGAYPYGYGYYGDTYDYNYCNDPYVDYDDEDCSY
jgi:hypothetical protein